MYSEEAIARCLAMQKWGIEQTAKTSSCIPQTILVKNLCETQEVSGAETRWRNMKSKIFLEIKVQWEVNGFTSAFFDVDNVSSFFNFLKSCIEVLGSDTKNPEAYRVTYQHPMHV